MTEPQSPTDAQTLPLLYLRVVAINNEQHAVRRISDSRDYRFGTPADDARVRLDKTFATVNGQQI